MNTAQRIQQYAAEKVKLWESFPIQSVLDAYTLIENAYNQQRAIYVCGNGGSVGVAANMINDFNTVPFMPDSKDVILDAHTPRLRGISLCESPTALTATMNDLGPEYIFSEQLKVNGVTEGDVLIALSGSGNSANIIEAVNTAHAAGSSSIGITRGSKSKLVALSTVPVIISGHSDFPGQTGGNNFNFHYEDAVSAIGHIITGLLKERVQQPNHVNA